MSKADPRHGTHLGYRSDRCRCPECTEAWRIYCNGLRAIRASKPIPDHVEHGSHNAYSNYMCRCDICKEGELNRQRLNRWALDQIRNTKEGTIR